MTNQDMTTTVNDAVAKFGLTARSTGGVVSIYDKKGRLAGTVDADGNIERKYVGQKTLMGAIVRDAIKAIHVAR